MMCGEMVRLGTYDSAESIPKRTTEEAADEDEEDLQRADPGDGRGGVVRELVGFVVGLVDAVFLVSAGD
jgi:hypothetical protein